MRLAGVTLAQGLSSKGLIHHPGYPQCINVVLVIRYQGTKPRSSISNVDWTIRE